MTPAEKLVLKVLNEHAKRVHFRAAVVLTAAETHVDAARVTQLYFKDRYAS